MMKMLKQLYDQGILLVAGTDGFEVNALHHELELYVGVEVLLLNNRRKFLKLANAATRERCS